MILKIPFAMPMMMKIPMKDPVIMRRVPSTFPFLRKKTHDARRKNSKTPNGKSGKEDQSYIP